MHVSIKWTNTRSDKVVNSHIEDTLSGDALDRSKVTLGDNGLYRSADNTIVWDKNSTTNLVSILPGESNSVSFSMASILNSTQLRAIKNPHINLHVVMTGDRSGIETGEVTSSQDVIIKISSDVTLSAKSYRGVGPLTNSGPIPPRADHETTYTIAWSMTNTTNNLKDTVV